MISYLILFGIFALIALFSLATLGKDQPMVIFISIAALLIVTAGFRDGTAFRDYSIYELMYTNYQKISLLAFEPTFILLSAIVKYVFFDKVIVLFVLYGIIGVSVKFCAIRQLSQFYYLSVLFYFSNYFLLHEMTQIRAGVAAGFLLLCIKPIYNRDFASFFFFNLLAFLFHYSAIIFLPFYFLLPKKMDSLVYVLLLIGTYLLHFVNIHATTIFYLIPAENLQFKLESYKNLVEFSLQEKLNVFKPLQVARIGLCLFLLWKKDLIFEQNKYAFILLKIYFIAVFAIPLFADIPTFAIRSSELLGVVEIIMLPMAIYAIKETKIVALATVALCFAFLCVNFFYTKLIVFK
ncbi:EpsG family protein [Parasediminibacterium sp. JCM 36343]|uniref:EpsG family protein n=1 Tax=Parasediminibacterium sp. JCM 36343 TaxID=3374279 RepID=UPI0039796869